MRSSDSTKRSVDSRTRRTGRGGSDDDVRMNQRYIPVLLVLFIYYNSAETAIRPLTRDGATVSRRRRPRVRRDAPAISANIETSGGTVGRRELIPERRAETVESALREPIDGELLGGKSSRIEGPDGRRTAAVRRWCPLSPESTKRCGTPRPVHPKSDGKGDVEPLSPVPESVSNGTRVRDLVDVRWRPRSPSPSAGKTREIDADTGTRRLFVETAN